MVGGSEKDLLIESKLKSPKSPKKTKFDYAGMIFGSPKLPNPNKEQNNFGQSHVFLIVGKL